MVILTVDMAHRWLSRMIPRAEQWRFPKVSWRNMLILWAVTFVVIICYSLISQYEGDRFIEKTERMYFRALSQPEVDDNVDTSAFSRKVKFVIGNTGIASAIEKSDTGEEEEQQVKEGEETEVADEDNGTNVDDYPEDKNEEDYENTYTAEEELGGEEHYDVGEEGVDEAGNDNDGDEYLDNGLNDLENDLMNLENDLLHDEEKTRNDDNVNVKTESQEENNEEEVVDEGEIGNDVTDEITDERLDEENNIEEEQDVAEEPNLEEEKLEEYGQEENPEAENNASGIEEEGPGADSAGEEEPTSENDSPPLSDYGEEAASETIEEPPSPEPEPYEEANQEEAEENEFGEAEENQSVGDENQLVSDNEGTEEEIIEDVNREEQVDEVEDIVNVDEADVPLPDLEEDFNAPEDQPQDGNPEEVMEIIHEQKGVKVTVPDTNPALYPEKPTPESNVGREGGHDYTYDLADEALGDPGNDLSDDIVRFVPDPFMKRVPNRNYTNLMKVKRPEYLPHHRSPCWKEPMGKESPYTSGYYYNARTVNRDLAHRVEMHWSRRLDQGAVTRMRCLPFFYVAGFTRCGTADVYRNIMRHPQVARIQSGELHWWSKRRVGRLSELGYVPISNYVDMFDDVAEQVREVKTDFANGTEFHPLIFGDASSTTLWFNYDWKRLPENRGREDTPLYYNFHYIHQVTPGAHFIVMVRNPADRMYSHYLATQMQLERTPQTFQKYVEEGIANFRNCLEKRSMMSCLTDEDETVGWVSLRAGLYEPYLKELLQVFPREQVLVVRLEDYKQDRLKEINKILNFLGIKTGLPKMEVDLLQTDRIILNQRARVHLDKGDMLPKTRTILDNFYKTYNEALMKLLNNNDAYLWKGMVK